VDSRLKRYYERELRHLRETAGEFARDFPKIAGRLGLSDTECADPYVERLLEGFAFMAARVQLKIDAEFPRFTQHLLEAVYPHYLAPTPSMCVVRFEPDLDDASLAGGFTVPRGTALRSVLGRGERTPCEYRTAHEVTLLPLRITRAAYHTRDVGLLNLPERFRGRAAPKAALQIRIESTAGLSISDLGLRSLDVYLRGSDQTPIRLYEQLFAHSLGMVVRPPTDPAPWQRVLPRESVAQLGFEDDHGMLPLGPRSIQGYRLVREYFAFPQRYMFLRLDGLADAVSRCEGRELELILPLGEHDLELEDAVDAENISLFCTPAVNLFPKRADRAHVSEKQWEFHVVPDRTRPKDFEVYEVRGVEGYSAGGEELVEFRPFYAADDFDGGGAYYAINRRARVMSSKERREGRSSKYSGGEVFVSLVDASNAPFRGDIRQLGFDTLCTNRHLPLRMPVGVGPTDFTTELGAGVRSVRVITGPTEPRPSYAEGETAWRLIGHLKLNYLSLIDADQREGAGALRDLLKLYGDASDPVLRRQVDGVRTIGAEPVTRRVPVPGPIAFARGLRVTVGLEEPFFEGTGIFVLGAVLERFFAKHVSINSFTETTIRSTERGEVMRWPPRIGLRSVL